MRNSILVVAIVALIAGAALFNFDNTESSNELKQFEEFKSNYGRIYTG